MDRPDLVKTIRAAIALGATASALYGLSKLLSSSEAATVPDARLSSKTVDASAITYSAKVLPEMCDTHGRMYGGELLKLIDVAAGLVAAKHAGAPCLTVSLDRVIFLQEIRVDDVVHLSSAVNRAWNTSMEIGIRVMREPADSPASRHYACHSYLTFVVANPAPARPATPSLLDSALTKLGLRTTKPKKKPKLPEVTPTSTLEHKRYLLAGRRRAMRMQNREKVEHQHAAAREQLLAIERERAAQEKAVPPGYVREDTEQVLAAIQREMLVEAFMKDDPILEVNEDEDYVEAKIEGFMEPVRAPLAEIRKASRQKGHGGYRRLSVRVESDTSAATARESSRQSGHYYASSHDQSFLQMPIVMSLWIIRPQFANSKGILFGGSLMHDIEQTASIAARRIYPGPWASAAIDSLSFLSPVHLGEAIYVRCCILRVWDSSVEAFCVVYAEDRNSPKPTMRLVSQAFFSLVAIDAENGRPLRGRLRQVRIPDGPLSALAAESDKRKEERLQDKRILQRVYS